MSLTRRLLLSRGALGALLAPLVGPAAGSSVAGRLAAGATLTDVGRNAMEQGNPVATGSSALRAFTPAWWSHNRWMAEDEVLAAGYTLPVDADVAGLRSLSAMARQRIMRRRCIERHVAERTAWDRAEALFSKGA